VQVEGGKRSPSDEKTATLLFTVDALRGRLSQEQMVERGLIDERDGCTAWEDVLASTRGELRPTLVQQNALVNAAVEWIENPDSPSPDQDAVLLAKVMEDLFTDSEYLPRTSWGTKVFGKWWVAKESGSVRTELAKTKVELAETKEERDRARCETLAQQARNAILEIRIAVLTLSRTASYEDAYRSLVSDKWSKVRTGVALSEFCDKLGGLTEDDRARMRRAWKKVCVKIRADPMGLKFASQAFDREKEVTFLHSLGRILINSITLRGRRAADGRKFRMGRKYPDWVLTDVGKGDLQDTIDILAALLYVEEKRSQCKTLGTQQLVTDTTLRLGALLDAMPSLGATGLFGFGIVSTVSELQVVRCAFRHITNPNDDRPLHVEESEWVPLLPQSILDGDIPEDPTEGFELLWRLLNAEAATLGWVPVRSPQAEYEEEGGAHVHVGRRLGAGGTSIVYACEMEGTETDEVVKVANPARSVYEDIVREASVLRTIHARFEAEPHPAGEMLLVPTVLYPAGPSAVEGAVHHVRMKPRGVPIAQLLWTIPRERALATAVLIVGQVLRSLRWTHRAGFVHSDVRVPNMLWVDLRDSPDVGGGGGGGGGAAAWGGGAAGAPGRAPGTSGACYLIDFASAVEIGTRRVVTRGGDSYCVASGMLSLASKPFRALPLADIVGALFSLVVLANLSTSPGWMDAWMSLHANEQGQPGDLIAARNDYLRKSALGTAVLARIDALFDAAAELPDRGTEVPEDWYSLEFVRGVSHLPTTAYKADVEATDGDDETDKAGEKGVEGVEGAPLTVGVVGDSEEEAEIPPLDAAAKDRVAIEEWVFS
jgi:hypothetical protein